MRSSIDMTLMSLMRGERERATTKGTFFIPFNCRSFSLNLVACTNGIIHTHNFQIRTTITLINPHHRDTNKARNAPQKRWWFGRWMQWMKLATNDDNRTEKNHNLNIKCESILLANLLKTMWNGQIKNSKNKKKGPCNSNKRNARKFRHDIRNNNLWWHHAYEKQNSNNNNSYRIVCSMHWWLYITDKRKMWNDKNAST